ncbi:methyltransferase-like protein 17, mitochondrial [Biomphalaria glabrata]|uniref:Methyltransferase-like protein 17, mitochondrial n=1 Tax=Biomphalaria glabrata TaxID=6526 RepID=A0A9W3AVE2_BIOGL|nr:methyltransferase-like protein 17, mitochondrial [Biomphalaria glabrata]
MSASLRHTLFLGFQRNRFIEKYTCCIQNFLINMSHLKMYSTDSPGNIVTKHTKVSPEVATLLEQNGTTKSGELRYRSHPGTIRRNRSQLPSRLIKAIKILLEKYPVKSMEAETEKLNHYLQHRQIPVSDRELTEKAREIEAKIVAKEGEIPDDLHGLELENARDAMKKKVFTRLKKIVYHWKPIQYDAFSSYIYLLGCMAIDYSILLQCFTEISKRDSNFKPMSVYNFGSKVGAAIWAADKLWGAIGEYYCVDNSVHMNTIAQLLLQDANEQSQVFSIKGVHFRLNEPSPKNNKFSLVVSANMLIEKPTYQDRLQLVHNLWEMADNYLVLVENGTGAGFTLINEARDYLTQVFTDPSEEKLHGHIFAPCPHNKPCPRVSQNTHCFTECIVNEPIWTSVTDKEKPRQLTKYSYLIVKKGARNKAECYPRVLQENRAHKHTHLHLCLPCGQLQRTVVNKNKFDRHVFGCARSVACGDLLPVVLSDEASPIENQEISEHSDEHHASDDTCTKAKESDVPEACH